MSTIPVLVVGAGRMGQRIASLLGQDGRFAALIAASDKDTLAQAGQNGLATSMASGSQFRDDLNHLVKSSSAVILTDGSISSIDLAEIAYKNGSHYLDIIEKSGNSEGLEKLLYNLPAQSHLCFAPGCGLAPGHVTGLAAEVLEHAGPLAEITVFVGVLPAKPTNRLGYANIWSIDGLIGEYSNKCLAIKGGDLIVLPPLTEKEQISVGGFSLEAFTTAGSIDGLAQQYAGRVDSLVFKTLRYPGHLNYIEFLLHDMGLTNRLYQLRNLLMTALPKTENDRVLIALRVRENPEANEQWTYQVLHAKKVGDHYLSAIGAATASHVCAMTDLICTQRSQAIGFIGPGSIGPQLLRASPFFDHIDPAKQSQSVF